MLTAAASYFYHVCETATPDGRCHCACNQVISIRYSDDAPWQPVTLNECDSCPHPHPTLSTYPVSDGKYQPGRTDR